MSRNDGDGEGRGELSCDWDDSGAVATREGGGGQNSDTEGIQSTVRSCYFSILKRLVGLEF